MRNAGDDWRQTGLYPELDASTVAVGARPQGWLLALEILGVHTVQSSPRTFNVFAVAGGTAVAAARCHERVVATRAAALSRRELLVRGPGSGPGDGLLGQPNLPLREVDAVVGVLSE